MDADCEIIKVFKDSVFQPCYLYKNIKQTGDDFDKAPQLFNVYCNLENIFIFTKDTVNVYMLTQKNNINITSDLNYLGKVEALIRAVNDTSCNITSGMVKWNEEDCYFFKVNHKDIMDVNNIIQFTEWQDNYYIRKKDYIPIKITSQLKFLGNYSLDEWEVSNFQFDKLIQSNLENYFQNKTKYSYFKNYVQSESPTLLDTGIFAPIFSGTDFLINEIKSLTDYRGKIVILDFFYTACYACGLACPYLVEIQKEYEDKDVIILGIDSYDNENQKYQSRLKDYISKFSINYPILMTKMKEVDDIYHISGYPTLYVIDKNGIIRHVHEGFTVNMKDELKKVLDSL